MKTERVSMVRRFTLACVVSFSLLLANSSKGLTDEAAYDIAGDTLTSLGGGLVGLFAMQCLANGYNWLTHSDDANLRIAFGNATIKNGLCALASLSILIPGLTFQAKV